MASIYVDADAIGATHNGATWGTAFQDIQTALGAAKSGDQVRVASGIYRPTTTADRTVSFQLKNGVSLLGGYAGYGAANPDARDVDLYPTILSGNIGASGSDIDNSYHVITGGSGITAATILDGVTITAGNASAYVSGPSSPTSCGGGIYLNTASPTLTNCTFIGNSAGGDGYGAYYYGGGMYNLSSSPTLTNCTFIGNSASSPGSYGGGMYNSYSLPTLTNCTFVGNSAGGAGGGMSNSASTPALTHCMFSGNRATSTSSSSGGGIYNAASSSPSLSSCTFNGNSATSDGGGIYNMTHSSPTLSNCTFTGNAAGSGGGMYNIASSSPTLSNCTFTGNSAGSDGGGIYNIASGSPTLGNCTFSGNSATRDGGGMYNVSDGSPTLSNCSFSGNSASRDGGGMYNRSSSSPILSNCTFSGNSASSSGGGMANYSFSSPVLTNCIIWGSNSTPISNGDSTSVISYSNIEGGYAGLGNVNIDPCFVRNPSSGTDGVWGTADDDYGDLRLQLSSPVIDAGNNAAPGLAGVTTDLAGRGRFRDVATVADTGSGTAPVVDMGAYESHALVGITLSSGSVAENQPAGTAVGTLSCAADEVGDTFSYSLVDGDGSADNGLFRIVGDQLVTAVSLNYEASGSYSIRVRVADQDGVGTENAFTINITDVNERPAVGGMSKMFIQDTMLPFSGADFVAVFSDPDVGDSLQAIEITSLPMHGQLQLDGVALVANQAIAVNQLGTLTYVPTGGYVGPDSFGWTGSDGNLYSLAEATVDLTIYARSATAAAVESSASHSTYGQAVTFTATVTSADGIPTGSVQFLIDGILAGTPVTLAADGSATCTMWDLNAGSYSISVHYSGDVNFNASENSLAQTVNPAVLIVSATAQIKTYGQANPTLAGTSYGIIGDDAITISYTTAATQFSHAGDYAITPTFDDPNNELGNYIVTPNSAVLTINKAEQTINWATPSAILYGTALSDAQLNATVAGVADGSAGGALIYSPAAGAVLTVGNQTLTVTAAGTADYNKATLSVNQMVQTPVVVRGTGNPDRIVVNMNGNVLVWRVNGLATRMPVDQVASIKIKALAGDDTVVIKHGVMGVLILGGAGDDTVTGGDGNDVIKGGGGNDLLSGIGGDDRMLGQAGDDMMYGGGGNDVLDGGAGRDIAYGGGGADTFYARDGQTDVLFGGPGRDTATLDDLLDSRAQNEVLA